MFHDLLRLCKIVVTIPVSTTVCEGNLVKTYLRSHMDDDRLSNLGVLSVESRRAKSLDLDEFVNQFALNDSNHRI